MKIRTLGRFGFAFLASTLLTVGACGDDGTTSPGSDTLGSDSGGSDTISGDSGSGDSGQPDGTENDGAQSDVIDETSAPTDAADSETNVSDTNVSDTTASDTSTNDGDASVGPAVTTATITLGETTLTVTPDLRRGFSYAPRQSKTASALEYQPVTLSCGPKAQPDDGGKVIIVRDANIGGGFGGLCGQNLAIIDSADDETSRVTSNACSGGNDCTYNPWETAFRILEECTTFDLGLSIDYDCMSLIPAPSFILEHLSPELNLTIIALDGIGPSTCEDRGARIFVDGTKGTFAPEEPCQIDITTRTANTLAGIATGTVILADGTRKALTVTFRHDLNVRRPLAGINTGTDVCATNELSHTTTVDGADTIDTITVGTLMCQANPDATLPGFTMALRRPRAGAAAQTFACEERILLSSEGRVTDPGIGGFCERAFKVDEQADALRAAFYNVTLCASLNDCAPVINYLYISYSFENLAD